MSQSQRFDSQHENHSRARPRPCPRVSVSERPAVPVGAGAAGEAKRVPATLFLMVGLPGAGKTTRAKELAAAHRALRLTPDEWMIPLFGEPMPTASATCWKGGSSRWPCKRCGWGPTSCSTSGSGAATNGRRCAGWRSAGASCRVVYLPVDRDVQLARIAHRQATASHTTFPMTEADVDKWREQFQVPDAAELRDGHDPRPATSLARLAGVGR